MVHDGNVFLFVLVIIPGLCSTCSISSKFIIYRNLILFERQIPWIQYIPALWNGVGSGKMCRRDPILEMNNLLCKETWFFKFNYRSIFLKWHTESFSFLNNTLTHLVVCFSGTNFHFDMVCSNRRNPRSCSRQWSNILSQYKHIPQGKSYN